MIQLGYYNSQQQQHEESLDFDANYDPSDFLIKKDSSGQDSAMHIQQQYSEPYDYANTAPEQPASDEAQLQQQQNFYGSFSNQAFNANDFSFQQPQQMSQDEYSQPQMQPPLPDGGGLADLEISDSDDEGEPVEEMNTSNTNQADTSKEDDDGLWF